MMKLIQTIVTRIALVVLMLGNVFPQSVDIASAQKFDEFSDTSADNEMAHLDLLAVALGKDTKARGYVIGYTEQRIPPGNYLRRIFGYRDYLVNMRGIEPTRVEVIAGGNKDKISTELWLVPDGAPVPVPVTELKVSPKSPLIFDVAYPDCPPEMTTHLYELEDSLKFYAEALHRNPNTQGWVIAYPGQRTRVSKVTRMVRDVRNRLKHYDVGTERIVARAGKQRRECTEVELWIVPGGTVPPLATPHNSSNQTPR